MPTDNHWIDWFYGLNWFNWFYGLNWFNWFHRLHGLWLWLWLNRLWTFLSVEKSFDEFKRRVLRYLNFLKRLDFWKGVHVW